MSSEARAARRGVSAGAKSNSFVRQCAIGRRLSKGFASDCASGRDLRGGLERRAFEACSGFIPWRRDGMTGIAMASFFRMDGMDCRLAGAHACTVMPAEKRQRTGAVQDAGAQTGPHCSRSVLDCASPLALLAAHAPESITVSRCARRRASGPGFPVRTIRRLAVLPSAAFWMQRRRGGRSRWSPDGAARAQRSETNFSHGDRLLKRGPQCVQAGRIGRFTPRDGIESTVALREMNQQFTAVLDAGHDRHRPRCVLAEPRRLAKEQLLQLFKERVGVRHVGRARARCDRAWRGKPG